MAESFEEGVNISEVARRNGAARGLLTVWRRQVAAAVAGKAPSFVVPRAAARPTSAFRRRRRSSASPTKACGVIEIELNGGANLDCAGCGAGDAFDGTVGASGHPVIALRSDLKVVLAAQPVDFRKSVHMLSALVIEALRANPYCGDFFVFRSKRMDRVKLVAWDGAAGC
ncbi:IS66 family insertion sequence element accessory protein TnpB [Bradyrhizobium sp. UFLA01-814]|uniref:IS66 family insertion sequence element accessory protein TnpB n=1 Tax=Bradyrhizobium sp. UFLA01-814 TaxID=3023480 RepID=UPI00398AC5F3